MAIGSLGLPVGQYVTTQLGGAWTPQKARFFNAWAQAEGTSAAYNPFATTRRGYPGETQFNTVGVKNYPNLAVGQRATLDTLKNGYYSEIVNLLKRDDVTAEQLAAAVAASPWGTGAGVLRVLGVKQAADYEKVSSRQKWGAKKAVIDAPFKAEIAAANAQVQAINEIQARLVSQANQLLAPSEGWINTLNRLGQGGRKLASVAQGFQPIQAQATPLVPEPEPSVVETTQPTEQPTPSGKMFILPKTFTGTHQTSNLGWGTTSAHDFMKPPGTPLGAPEAGVITAWDPEGAQGGGRIRIKTNSGKEFWIGHIANAPPAGTTLKRGSYIGVVAQQNVSAPHVHEDVRTL